jgi:dihydrofolate reductase
MIRLCLIAAAAENGAIGKDNKLPWEIKSEWQYFKRMTKHKPVIEGRLTFESRGKVPFKDRPNIVITRQPGYEAEGVILTDSLEKAIGIAKEIAAKDGQEEIMIGGGAEIYKLALPLADRLYLTEIHLKPEGDTFFPPFDRAAWVETKNEFHKAQPGETADYTIRVFDRKK